jgi:hypothetical protein
MVVAKLYGTISMVKLRKTIEDPVRITSPQLEYELGASLGWIRSITTAVSYITINLNGGKVGKS